MALVASLVPLWLTRMRWNASKLSFARLRPGMFGGCVLVHGAIPSILPDGVTPGIQEHCTKEARPPASRLPLETTKHKSQLKSIANGFPALRNLSRTGVCLPDQYPLCACPVLMSRGLNAMIRRGGGSARSNVCGAHLCMAEQVVLWEWKPPPTPG